jgi:hypothetical protein
MSALRLIKISELQRHFLQLIQSILFLVIQSLEPAVPLLERKDHFIKDICRDDQ